jgi:hypothetical protein
MPTTYEITPHTLVSRPRILEVRPTQLFSRGGRGQRARSRGDAWSERATFATCAKSTAGHGEADLGCSFLSARLYGRDCAAAQLSYPKMCPTMRRSKTRSSHGWRILSRNLMSKSNRQSGLYILLCLVGYPLNTQGIAVQAQLEPDLTMYWVPPDAKVVSDVKLSRSLQAEGFPLRPTSLTCSDKT